MNKFLSLFTVFHELKHERELRKQAEEKLAKLQVVCNHLEKKYNLKPMKFPKLNAEFEIADERLELKIGSAYINQPIHGGLFSADPNVRQYVVDRLTEGWTGQVQEVLSKALAESGQRQCR